MLRSLEYPFVWAKGTAKRVLEYARLAMGFTNVQASRYGIRQCVRRVLEYSITHASESARYGTRCDGRSRTHEGAHIVAGDGQVFAVHVALGV